MKKIIITAGGTSERIDNVRKITNSSSGKLGMTIANYILSKKEDIMIYYICSKDSLRPIDNRVKIIEVNGTINLKDTIKNILVNEKIDYFIHSMAVSDYMVNYVTTTKNIKNSVLKTSDIDDAFNNIEELNGNKISSNEEDLVIMLKPTPKVISTIKNISPSTYLVGFKLLDGVPKEELITVANNLKIKNKCNLVVANDLSNIRNGKHIAYIIDENNNIQESHGKYDIAKNIVEKMFNNENYEIINVLNMNNTCINKLYKYLIINKYHFLILYWNNKKYVLTKEKSIIEIDDEKIFLKDINNDVYYKTIIKNDYIKINNKDLKVYKKYINMYKDILTKNKYADKYYFGCVAVKTNNGFITTIRGKENLDDYTIIENVDHVNHTIYAINKKGSLNVPLLDYLFKNTNAQIIVHLHEYDSNLPYYEYAFPGTVKDSIRCNKTSFNIKHHGVIYIFDKKGRLI